MMAEETVRFILSILCDSAKELYDTGVIFTPEHLCVILLQWLNVSQLSLARNNENDIWKVFRCNKCPDIPPPPLIFQNNIQVKKIWKLVSATWKILFFFFLPHNIDFFSQNAEKKLQYINSILRKKLE